MSARSVVASPYTYLGVCSHSCCVRRNLMLFHRVRMTITNRLPAPFPRKLLCDQRVGQARASFGGATIKDAITD